MRRLSTGVLCVALLWLAGCTPPQQMKHHKDVLSAYTGSLEPEWIRNGDPLEFEGTKWYPKDDVETFLEDEVYPVGTYKGLQIFVDKVDVRPFDRLYTKFDDTKYRVFMRRNS